MTGSRSRVALVLLLTTQAGCLHRLSRQVNGKDTAERAGEPDSYSLVGEVRDFATMAVVPGAVVEATSDVPGYVPKVTMDGHGGFVVTVAMVPRHNTGQEQLVKGLIVGDPYLGERLVREVGLRARAGTRCSPVLRQAPREFPRKPFFLWLEDCAGQESTHR
ncbi:MAG: hypothetical protein QM704_26305 [Anaeromyxobacteraceae bacterium]